MSSERAASALETHHEPFHYVQMEGENSATDSLQGEAAWNADARSNENAKKSAEQTEKKAYERGLRDGAGQTQAACESQIAEVRRTIGVAIEKFKSEREAYFNRTEPEVVQLALAIARKILHREAHMDPLLLTGVVHVALEKLDAGSRVRLRAHPNDVRQWANSFEHWDTTAAPEIIGDAALQAGECALETELGSTHLSLDTQLKEIEQGFMDLLEQRPRVR